MSVHTASNKVNVSLFRLGLTYHDFLPIDKIDAILEDNGFIPTEPAIYCGRDGKATHAVGSNRYLHMTWHKMESGRYEVVAYLN